MTNSFFVLISLAICNGMAAGPSSVDPSVLAGQDLHLTAPVMTVCHRPDQTWSQVILLEDGVMVQIGDNLLNSQKAVLYLEPQTSDAMGEASYLARAYLEGQISVQKGPKAKTTAVRHFLVEGADVLMTQFLVTGEIFAVADTQRPIAPEQLSSNELYIRASEALLQLPTRPQIPQSALVPDIRSIQDTIAPAGTKTARQPGTMPSGKPGVGLPSQQQPSESVAEFPVHLSAVWEPIPQIEKRTMPDGREVITASGRFYLWQKRSEENIVEFLADEMVFFFEKDQFAIDQTQGTGSQIGFGKIQSVYLRGNIVMTEGERTTRADEIYYDFWNQRALVVNASMRVFDEKRGLPIYLRAKMLGHVSENIYEAQDVQLTSSEFYFPQVSLNASKMVLLSDEAVQQYLPSDETSDVASQYEGRLYDVRAKYGDFTFFRWPKIVTNFKRPDIPLSRIRVGNDSQYGTSVETRWHLARLLGIKDPAWLDSQLALDYFGKRGVGAGVEAEYEKDDAKGSLIGYIMTDRGQDDLGRTTNRRNLDPQQDIRGRLSFRHRQFLPDDWQLTVEASYISDRNFLEWMYRDEFYTDKGQETLVYLKRLRDNWAFSILGKIRINDFETMTEELPSIEYHLKGQSFWDNRLTWYSDNQAARFRNRFDEDGAGGNGEFYTFAYTRNEVDLPLTWETIKFVPYVAGSYSLEDGQGYYVDLDGTTKASGEDHIFLGEVGLRASTMFWKDDPYVHSDLWDLNGIRHIVTPYAEVVTYHANDASVDMRDAVHVGVSQRWQTHRGSEENRRTLDWIRLDTEATWVGDDADSSISPLVSGSQLYGPAAFVYNDPSIPLLLRRDTGYYGIVRDTINGEFVWRVSDTLSLLSDMNYDMNSGYIQQFDAGMSRYVYPDISYYLGTRYLRPLIVNVDENDDGVNDVHEVGSHSFVAAVTYRLTPRYIATFSQEYNFDYAQAVRSDLTVVRQYHRMFYAMSFSFDQSLKRNAVIFSIWPQGVKELAVGSRKYTGLTGARRED
ncbi:MAG: LPS assembly protein LptD [Phycisphaerae bacterium]|nr:LPS assembly protein LptD [Phycisphaerae bacterium]